ncbi:hypothetical protein A2767_04025 [Candidatus Roizmanbacteria bacterium RIFCSPHIGHO2_01_FULL_35_10]|uniref:Uncharacterized protein n=1 Tax=Candidatus Roizmanbacteria bacterium RIFCSPLOWO2_01_FULL_35_13 TaxID=1802055 RepID=A0A1F7IFL0_9BACT|nr:MAG: hypothetical protein A2767_04025 [Candidatus Roizmanbacteria bacterium RIFCSPHIGHO2_01_FULL_35_10]OGK42120.1 MAG: hypothetical protein A3A74_04755 [Candidatus Roizmanbacteria bacterium RIFCSPLOWO2_01_FULL_35_13]
MNLEISTRLAEIRKGLSKKPVFLATYPSFYEGVADSSFNQNQLINGKGPELVYMGKDKAGTALGIKKDVLKGIIKKGLWIKLPDSNKNIYWDITGSTFVRNDYEVVSRDATVEKVYYNGAVLYLKVKNEQIKVSNIGFGYDAGAHTFHNIPSTAEFRTQGGEFGKLNPKIIAEILSQYSWY